MQPSQLSEHNPSPPKRDHRIELAEIEAMLQRHPALHAAAVVILDLPSGSQIVAYVVEQTQQARTAEAELNEWDTENVARWREIFDAVYSQDTRSEQDSQLSLRVWISSYTGQQIPEPEIFECIDDSVERVLALQPQRVLELGCGSGLLLFRIAPRCKYYCGTDFSQEVLHHLAAQVRQQQDHLPEIALFQRAADDLEGIPESAFDVAILNEVAQYFPSINYLVQVLERVITRVKPGGAIFVGGIRSLPLLAAFHTSVQLYQAPATLTIPELRQRVQQHLAQEKELVVDPAFFAELQRRLPGITDLRIQLKGGQALNELTKFRYDVVLRVGSAALVSGTSQQLDWQAAGLTVAAVRRMLVETTPQQLCLIRVPNARVLSDLAAIDLLANPGDLATAGDLKQALRASAPDGVQPVDLWALGRDLPYSITISWAVTGEPGYYDVVLTRRTAEQIVSAAPAGSELALDRPIWTQYANHPLQAAASGTLVSQLRSYLSQQLPPDMVPAAFIPLPALPLDTTGQLDREALRSLAAAQHLVPRTPVEESLLQIWADVLRLPAVGLQSDFFALGGNRALAEHVVSRARAAFGVELSFEQLFATPTVEAAALAIEYAVLDEIEQLGDVE